MSAERGERDAEAVWGVISLEASPLPAPSFSSSGLADRTRAKLGDDKEKRMRFLLQMLQLFYALMIGKDAAIDGTPFQQHLGPVRT